MTSPLVLHVDLDALAANWRWFARRGAPAETGAAVKADGYGLGARQVVERLAREGCRHFFFTTYDEIESFGPVPAGVTFYALHGFRPGDEPRENVVPVLNTPEQVARWKAAAAGAPCDVKVDTGMNRLGLDWRSVQPADLDGLNIGTLHSHMACADEPDHPLNGMQLERFREVVARLAPPRASLCGSGAICLGPEYIFDLTRPGLGLYGGVPHPACGKELRQVASLRAEVLQVRTVQEGESVGYGGTWTAPGNTRLATINIGYADGYLRGFSSSGAVRIGGEECPVVGRVSMDVITVDLGCSEAAEGDFAEIVYDLPTAAAQSGLSQYELLTGLGSRYRREYS